MQNFRSSQPYDNHGQSWTTLVTAGVLLIFLLTTSGWAQTPKPAAEAPPAPPAQQKILSDVNQALQQQIKDFTEQLAHNQAEYKKSQEESHALGVAVSTHKAALSLDKITLEQAKDLQQYYVKLAEQKAKAAAALTQELEKYARVQSELREATQKTEGELAKPAKPRTKNAAQRSLEQQNGQYLKLAGTAISQLAELQKVTLSHLEVLQQEQAFLEEFSLILQKFTEEKFKTQLLERQKPSDILTLTKEFLTESLSLPQRLYDWASDKIQSGAAARLVRTHRSKLFGLLCFLGILLYAMKLLRRATRDFRLKLAAGAATFSLKLIMALANALVRNYYLLAITIWLSLSLWVMGVLAQPAAKILLGGLVAFTIMRLLKHLLAALFAPGQPDQGIISLDEATARYYSRNGFLILLFFVGGYYFFRSLKLLGYQQTGFNFGVLIYLIIMNSWFLWLLRRPYLENLLSGAGLPLQSRLFRIMRGLRLIVLLGLSAVIIIYLLGFQNLALYLAGSTFLSALLIAAGWLVMQLGKDLNAFLTSPHGIMNVTFGIKAETLDGFKAFLSQALTILITGLTAAAILLTWGVDIAVLQKIAAFLSRGPSLGPLTLSPLAISLAILTIWLVRKISHFTLLVLETGVFRRRHWDIGIQHTIANIIHYTLMTLGIIVALAFLGINFSNLAIIAGGLGVGIGFGLQNIVNNFLSGLILLFERPIKVGDLLVIDGQWGTVKAIRVRSTVFETVERSVLIIPNSDLIANKILNWTFKGRGPNRLTLKVGVAYDANVHEVTKVIEKVCRQNPRVLAEPAPQVYFSSYGDSSLDFTVWVFVHTPQDRNPATHELNTAIFDAFNERGIEFPYPQMDLHLRTLPEQMQAKIPRQGDGT